MRTRFLAAAALVMASAGLAHASEAELAALDEARTRWQAAGMADYRFGYLKHCDCYRDAPPETVVTVSADTITRVFHLHADSDREVPAREGSLGDYWTIDDLFGKLATALTNGADVRAEYDAVYGYPTTLFIDYVADLVGDETELDVIRFEPN